MSRWTTRGIAPRASHYTTSQRAGLAEGRPPANPPDVDRRLEASRYGLEVLSIPGPEHPGSETVRLSLDAAGRIADLGGGTPGPGIALFSSLLYT